MNKYSIFNLDWFGGSSFKRYNPKGYQLSEQNSKKTKIYKITL